MASLHPSLPFAPNNDYGTKPSSRSVLQQSVLEIEATTTLEVEEISAVRNNNIGGGELGAGGNQREEMGICLTWKDLWVNASTGKKGNMSILQGLTGYAKPGQLLAIMGPSGCGKSTLLDALAGIKQTEVEAYKQSRSMIFLCGHKLYYHFYFFFIFISIHLYLLKLSSFYLK